TAACVIRDLSTRTNYPATKTAATPRKYSEGDQGFDDCSQEIPRHHFDGVSSFFGTSACSISAHARGRSFLERTASSRLSSQRTLRSENGCPKDLYPRSADA